jgi:Response regulators consisting of a CheY-like receiver domain and a winged-helix DNA-binding domain
MVKGTILVAEDEGRIRRMLKDYLTSCNYVVIEAADGNEALHIFYSRTYKIDLILLDVMMPNKDGFAVMDQVREVSDTPIIMLTAKSQEYDQLYGFKHGADDYITNPFSPAVLLAHLEAVLNRCKNNLDSQITVGDLSIDRVAMLVKQNNEILALSPKEYDLLVYMAENMDVVLTRDRILNEVWKYEFVGDGRTVDTHIKQLRAKIGMDYIQTIRGRGYRFGVSACLYQ